MFFSAQIKEGKFISNNISSYIKSLKDGEYSIEIKKSTRTQQQNKLYRSILDQINKDTGNGSDELHKFFKHMFLKKPILTALGEYDFIPTTTELDREEFALYINSIVLFCQEQGLVIITE